MKQKRRKLAEVRFHHHVDNSLERMQFNQVLGSTRGYYVGPVCLFNRNIAGKHYIHRTVIRSKKEEDESGDAPFDKLKIKNKMEIK